MNIEKIEINKLKPATYNPRQISKKQYNDLKDSIVKFGLVDPIILNKDFTVIGGHQRLKVCKQLKYKDIDCVVLDLTKEEERELNIRLNKSGGEFDMDILANEFDIEELKDWGFKEIELGLNIDKIIEGNTEDDHIPEVKESRVKLGDVWQLGKHRLMCGDSTKESDVSKLMNGHKVDMVFTDPPYGMNAVSKSGVLSKKYKKDIIGDDNTNIAEKSFNLINDIFKCPQVWWGANYYANIIPNSEGWIVWDKNNGQSDQTDCELAYTNLRSVCRLYKQASEKKNRVHPTQKPVSLFLWTIEKFNLKPDIVLDVFLGSGSTLIACEKTNRVCYGMELDTKYCDVIIERWEQFTGQKAVKCG
tara:strand:+ start:4468 stop:5547 length:1080 start_codon:yes stop_codon:yes gene_type:complete